MSTLLPPRLIFQGTTAWSPNTANNSPEAYDKRRVTTPCSDSAWLQELNEEGTDICGGWNLHGANDCAFWDVVIRRAQLVRPATRTRHDPIIGSRIEIQGDLNLKTGRHDPAQIVDVDPKHPITAHIFFESFRVGDRRCGFEGAAACPMAARWPVLERNLNHTGGLIRAGSAAVLWQAALPRHSITWHGTQRSPALTQLKEALELDRECIGLSVRFASYRTTYYQCAEWKGVRLCNPEMLSAAYRDGFRGVNPAFSMTLGLIGLWRKGELASAPCERLLLPTSQHVALESDGRYISPEFAHGARRQPAKPTHPRLGPAFFVVDTRRSVIVFDFLLTFPERDMFLEKAQLGSFIVQVRNGRQVCRVGEPIRYDDYARAAYESNGGTIELAFDPAMNELLQRGTLEIVPAERPRRRAMREQLIRADTDERGIYLDEEESRTIKIQVAGPPRSRQSIALALAQYDDNGELLTGRRRIVELRDGRGRRLSRGRLHVGRARQVHLSLRATRAGVCLITFAPFVGPTPNLPKRFAPARWPFLAVRALPFDNGLDARTRDSDLDRRFVYDHILRVYNVVYPGIARANALCDSDELLAHAEVIRGGLEADGVRSTRFLPVSRDLSAGKRRLLLRFLDLTTEPARRRRKR